MCGNMLPPMSLACGVSGTRGSAALPAAPSASRSPAAAASAAAKDKLVQACPQVRQRWIWEAEDPAMRGRGSLQSMIWTLNTNTAATLGWSKGSKSRVEHFQTPAAACWGTVWAVPVSIPSPSSLSWAHGKDGCCRPMYSCLGTPPPTTASSVACHNSRDDSCSLRRRPCRHSQLLLEPDQFCDTCLQSCFAQSLTDCLWNSLSPTYSAGCTGCMRLRLCG